MFNTHGGTETLSLPLGCVKCRISKDTIHQDVCFALDRGFIVS